MTEKSKAHISVNEEPTLAQMIAKLGDEGIVIFFTYVEDETSTVEASIADNFVETNHSMQDHIAIKPKIYRLRGCIGEVVYKNSTKFIETILSKADNHPILKNTIKASSAIGAVSPVVSNYTQLAINVVNQIESSYNRYKQMLDNIIPSRKPFLVNEMQEMTVAYLNRLLELRQEVNLKGLKFKTVLNEDAPDKKFERKYYLQSVSAHQGDNNYITDIEVTIKEFRIATTKATKLDPNKYGGLSAIQKTEEANSGPAKSQDVYMSTPADKPKYMTPIYSTQTVAGKKVQVMYNAAKYQSEVVK